MFGASIKPLRSEANLHRPYLALGTVDWPNWMQYQNGRYIPPYIERYKYTSQFDPGKAKDKFDVFPIRISHIQDLQQSSFWDKVVPSLGRSALTPPQILGNTAIKNRPTVRKYGKDWVRWIDPNTFEAEGVAALRAGETSAAEWAYAQDVRNRASAIKIALKRQYEMKQEEKEKQLEKQDPGQRARREKKAREEEAEETRILDHALEVYDPENENKSVKLYLSLKESKFSRVRAEALLCLYIIGSSGSEEWRNKQLRLGEQEMRLFNDDRPANDRIQSSLNTIGDRRNAHEQAKAEREAPQVGNEAAGGSTAMDIDDGELIEKDFVIVEEWEKVY